MLIQTTTMSWSCADGTAKATLTATASRALGFQKRGTKVSPGHPCSGQSDAGERWQLWERVPSMWTTGGCPLDAQRLLQVTERSGSQVLWVMLT